MGAAPGMPGARTSRAGLRGVALGGATVGS
jgi:hypothetical protein